MANVILSYGLFTPSSATASSNASSPWTYVNLLDMTRVHRAWRSANSPGGDVTITFDFGAAASASSFLLYDCNFRYAYLMCNSTNSFPPGDLANQRMPATSGNFELKLNYALNRYNYFQTWSKSYRYWQLVIPLSGQTKYFNESYYRMGIFGLFGSATSVMLNPSIGYRYSCVMPDPLRLDFETGYSEYFSRGTRRVWKGQIEYKYLTDTEVNEQWTIDAGIGSKATPFCFFENMGDAGGCYYVRKDYDLEVVWNHPSRVARSGDISTLRMVEVW